VSKTVDKVKSEFKNIVSHHSALKSQQRIEDEENKESSRVNEFSLDLPNQT
jgi:hypothetical protein